MTVSKVSQTHSHTDLAMLSGDALKVAAANEVADPAAKAGSKGKLEATQGVRQTVSYAAKVARQCLQLVDEVLAARPTR